MENKLDQVVELLNKSYRGSLNNEESLHLKQMLDSDSLRRVHDELIQNDLLREAIAKDEFSHKAAYKKFVGSVRGRYKRERLYTRIASAVAVACVLAVTVFLWVKTPVSKREYVAVKENVEIVHGKRQAQLTLGNGEVIQITEKNNLKVEDKGGVAIKYENGSLNYASGKVGEELIYNELVVPAGGEFFIMLQDSTKVWVNCETKLRYPVTFTADKREVYLSGEAYFDVKPGTKPFIVHTDAGDIRVMGTSFSVKAYNDENMITTLVTGKVKYMGKSDVELNPGEQITAYRDGNVVKRKVDVSEYVGWVDGNYIFDNRPLGDITRDLERWYDIKIEFQDQFLEQVLFTGSLKRYDNFNCLLEILESTGECRYQIIGRTVILKK